MKDLIVEGVEGMCTDCEQIGPIKVIDNGIGPYEYWGCRGVDVQLDVVSCCCEAAVLKENGTEYLYSDLPQPEPDEPY